LSLPFFLLLPLYIRTVVLKKRETVLIPSPIPEKVGGDGTGRGEVAKVRERSLADDDS
jgi:hypothetical protein